ncbi:MAG: hypothetical protein PUC85_05415 [bacterium]|nr:hypothetical protein [bacterium]
MGKKRFPFACEMGKMYLCWQQYKSLDGMDRSELREKDKVRREKLAGYFYDLSKLSFAGIFVSVIVPLFTETLNLHMWIAAIFGVVLTILSAMLANKILK